MNLINKNGYTLKNLDRINVLLGKNGSGKSTILRQVESALRNDKDVGLVKYITPERGGSLKYEAGIEQNISNDPMWLQSVLRKNQYNQFKEHSVTQFRKLELLSLREIERDHSIRGDLSITFDTVVGKINALLDHLEIKRGDSGFNIYQKGTSVTIKPASISSGESELISLGIECLVFDKECSEEKLNILFIDEPDVHLHPDLQSRFSSFLTNILESNKFHVIIATHSTALLGALGSYPKISVDFLQKDQKEINFKKVNEIYRKILPVFGAHPLSNLFNEAPILLVEGEDDERVWQQAVRTANGALKLYPCSVDTITKLNNYEIAVKNIINSVYDDAKAYSLRDRDEIEADEINDIEPIIRFRLSCRAAENLLLSDEVLTALGIDWETLKLKVDEWIKSNEDHKHFNIMKAFSEEGFPRKTYDLKKIRNDLMGIIGSHKPWEVAVGQVIGEMNFLESENSIKEYLGEKIYRHLIMRKS